MAVPTSIDDLSATPASNGPDGATDLPSAYDDYIRAVSAFVRQLRDGKEFPPLLSSVAGTDTITASAPAAITAYAAGQRFSFVASATNTSAVTLNINGIGAKSVTKDGATALAAGDIASGAVCVVVYDGTQFQLVSTKPVFATSAQAQEGTSTSTVISPDTLNDALNGPNWATGMVSPFARSTAPAGWVKANGGTIGNASSGATTRANADTSSLFSLLWSEFDNTALPIQDSSGAASTRGASAAADFAANKRLPIHDARGEFIRGLDDSRGVDSGRALGSAQLDAFQGHKHSTDAYTGDTNRDGGSFSTSATSSASVGNPITDGTNGTPRTAAETRPRNLAFLYCIKL